MDRQFEVMQQKVINLYNNPVSMTTLVVVDNKQIKDFDTIT